MNVRDEELFLTTLLGVSVGTLREWLAGEAVPPVHVLIPRSLIDLSRTAHGDLRSAPAGAASSQGAAQGPPPAGI